MKKTTTRLFETCVAFMLLVATTAAWAASGVWNGTVDSLWTSSANWSTSPYPSGSETASFNNAGNGQTTINVAGLASINNIIFDSPAVAAYTVGSGAANSQTLIMADGGVITFTDTAANSQVFNAGLQLGTTMAAGTYTITNANTSQTLTFNQVFGAPSGGTAAAKTLVLTGPGNTSILGDVWRGGASSLTLTHNSSGTLTMAGSNTVAILNMNGGSNSVVDIGSGYISLENGGGTILSSSQGGTINGTGTIRLSTGGGVNYGDVRPAAGKTLVINPSIISTGAGFELNDAGTVVLNGTNTWDLEVYFTAAGTISVSNIGNQGSTSSNLGKGTKIMQSVDNGRLLYTGTGETSDRIIELSKNFIIEHSGTGNLLFTSLFNVLGNTKTLTLQGSTAGVGEISGAIGPGSGTTSLSKSGTGTWILSAANTYAGVTTVNGGILIITGTNGAVNASTGYTINAGGTLLLDNTSTANNTNRLRDASTITMNGGTLCITNNGGAVNYLENAGTLAIASGGNSTISTTEAIPGQSNILTFTSLTYSGGKINFTGTGLGVSDQNRIFIAGVADGLMGAWATVNGTSYAAYSSTLGVYAAAPETTFTDIAAEGGAVESIIPDNGALWARINLPGVSGPITLQGEWTNSIGYVLQNTTTNTTIATFDGVTNKLLKAAGLSIAEGKAGLTVGENENDGTLSALTASGTLVLENNSAGNALTVNAAIINNTSASALSKIGAGMVVLNGTNTYTGTTYISEGVLAIAGASAQTVSGTTTIGNGTLAFAGSATKTVSAAISGAGKVVKTGTSTLNLNAANTFTGGLTINEGTVATATAGGLGAGAVTNNSTLNLTGGALTYTGLSTSLAGSGTNNVTLAIGTTATVILNGDYSGFTGLWNIGVGRLAGQSKIQMNGLDNSAATINILSNGTIYCSTLLTHNAKLVLEGGNTFESLGQLRMDAGASWAGPITLTGPITDGNDAFFGNGAASIISGVIDDLGRGYTVDKLSGGTLTFSGANTYSGPTWVKAGAISVPAMGSISGGASPLGSQTSAAAGKIRLGNGGTTTTLIYTGTGETSDRRIDMAGSTGGATLTHSGTGLLSLTGGMMISGAGNKTLTLQGSTAGKGEFSGIISNGVGSMIGVTKAGTGTWVLSGANTYTGATSVAGGMLLVNGSTANSAVTVNNGCTLGGSGTINGTVTMAAGSMMVPGDNNVIGTLTLGKDSANALTLNGSGLRYDLSNVVDVCDKIFITGASGALVLNGVNIIALAFPNGPAPAGDYTLMTFQAHTVAGSFVLAGNYPNASLILNANSLVLHVEGGSTTSGLIWMGNLSGIWDSGAPNWTNGSASVAYTPGDAVTFDDTATGNLTVSSDTPVSPASVVFNNSANAYTVSAAIDGTGSLKKIGSSTATLSGLSTYNPSSVTIAAGTLTLSGASLLNSGNYSADIINSATFDYASSATQTLSGVISGAGTLAKSGSGVLTLAGTNTFTGSLTVNSGALLLTGSNALATATVNVGAAAGNNAVVKMPPGGSLVGTGETTIGSVNNGNGAFYLSGGQVIRTNADAEKNFAFGTATGGYGYFNMSDGELSSQRIALGIAGNVGTALARITGGISTFKSWVLIGRVNGGIGVMTIDGGAVYHTNATANLSLNYDGGRGELNMTGGLFDNTGQALVIRNAAGSATGIVNICSGTLIVNRFANNATAFLNFNGGLLQASAASTTFLPANMTGVYVNGPFGANAGGARIDSAGKDITFAAPLLAPPGSGVTAISLSSKGSGYIGEPYVSIAGDGVGATAVANMVDDGTGKGTYKVDSVTVTAPGVNYTTAAVTFLKGGTAAVAPTVGSVTLATATPAGLTKLGTGVLTLGGVNTYGGETTISGGTLRLGVANALPTNSIVNVGSNVYDLGGFVVTNGQVNVTSGSIINGGLANTSLTVNDTAIIKAALSGNTGLTKNGPGTLILKGYASNFTPGPLVVNEGTLTLSLLSAPPSTGLSYWLDASDGSKITLAGSNVTSWADSSPAGVNFTNAIAVQRPVYVTNAINGLPAVSFAGFTNRLMASTAVNAQTVFILNKVNGSRSGNDGIWGRKDNDFGIRLATTTTWIHPGNTADFTQTGSMHINGIAGSTFPLGAPHILTGVRAASINLTSAIGDYWGNAGGYFRSYNGYIGEVLVYNSVLSTNDRQRVEGYLMNKWFGVASSGLPSVTLAEGAILDLDGQSLTVTNLVGSGTVSNGTLTVTGTLSPANTNVIGTLTAKANITLSGTFVADVDAGASDCLVVDGNLTLSTLAPPTLEIKNQESLNKFKMYTLATCSGSLSGTFGSTNLTDPRWTLRYTTDGKVQLYFKGGTILLLR